HKLTWLWTALLLATGSSLLGLYFPEKTLFGNTIHVGGMLGMIVSGALVSVFNFLGVSVILWTAALILIVCYREKTLGELLVWPKKLWNRCADFLIEYGQGWSIKPAFNRIVKTIDNFMEPKLAVESVKKPILDRFIPIPKESTDSEDFLAEVHQVADSMQTIEHIPER